MDESRGIGRVLSVGSGVLTGGVVLGLVSLYAYGLALPAERQVSATTTLTGTSPEQVWAVVGDPALRPRWRPGVERIARIDEGGDVPMWREMDDDSDRFDFLVTESVPNQRLQLQVAQPEQIGFEATWTWEIASAPEGARVTVSESGRIANPFFRGIRGLVASPHDTVDGELDMLAVHLGTSADIQH